MLPAERCAAAPSVPPLAAPAPSGRADYVAELKQLAEVCDAGIITEQEFAAKKQQLLD